MTSLAAADRTRGRPRQFDEEAVLDAVTMLFMEQGFEAASMAEIVEAAGLNKSSLYNAFGSKEDLFRRALLRYTEAREELLEQATAGERGLDDLVALVDLVRAETHSDVGRRGCLAINSTAELGFASPEVVELAERYRNSMRRSMRRPLERAAQLGEIRADMIDVYVDAMMSFLIAVTLSARGGASAEELDRHLDSLRRLIESWRAS